MKKVVGYVRLSSKEQAIGYTLEQQINRLVTERQVPRENIYYDLESGRTDDRENFQRLISDVREGLIKKIVAVRYDRFSRSGSKSRVLLDEIRNKYKVEIDFIDSPIPSGMGKAAEEFSIDMMASQARYESLLISERVTNGFKYLKRQGIPLNKSIAPFGYIINSNRKYDLDTKPLLCLLDDVPIDYLSNKLDYQAAFDNEFSLYNNENNKYINFDLLRNTILVYGRSRADIAKDIIQEIFNVTTSRGALTKIYKKYGIYEVRCKRNLKHEREAGFLSESGIVNWLMNPVLRGHISYLKEDIDKGTHLSKDKWDIVYDTHPDAKLISEDEYKLLEHIIENNRKTCTSSRNTYNYFNGLLFCGACGSKLTSRTSSHLDKTYKHIYYFCRNTTCDSSSIRLDKINNSIIQEVHTKALSSDALDFTSSDYDNSNPINEERVLILKRKLENIKELLQDDPTDNSLISLESKYKKELDQELLQVNSSNVWDKSSLDIIKHPACKDFGFLYTLSPVNRKLIYHKLIKKITIVKGKVINIIFNL